MQTKILNENNENLQSILATLKAGDLVALPSETVYGLAGDGLNEQALAKIFSAKERPHFDPLILHIGHRNQPKVSLDLLRSWNLVDFNKISVDSQKKIELLVENFWPGPLTLVLPKLDHVPDLATSGLSSMAIRMPAHPLFQKILNLLGSPLAAPSANRFGRISPTNARDVFDELQGRIPFVLDGGSSSVGVESSIIGFDEEENLVLFRPGGVSVKEIESCLNLKIRRQLHSEKPVAPGMLKSHYAPRVPLLLAQSTDEMLNFIENAKKKKLEYGVILSKESTLKSVEPLVSKETPLKLLSHAQDSYEAAKNLFRYFRDLDALPLDQILVECWPNEDALGAAIVDRMTRAAAPKPTSEL